MEQQRRIPDRISRFITDADRCTGSCQSRTQPAVFDVILRTALYSLGVLIVLLLEKAFDGRHEYGGFGPALMAVFKHADISHVWVNTICVSGALLGYNMLSIIRQHLGKGGLTRIFLSPPPEEPEAGHSRADC